MAEDQQKNKVSPEQPDPVELEIDVDQDPEVLVCKLNELTEERDQLLGKYQRALADLQNYQKRAARERRDAVQKAEIDTIERFLFPVIDDLDRAIQAGSDHGYDNNDPLFAGLTMVHQRMLELLRQYGIEPIEAEGKPFDPLYHQATMDQPTDEHPEGHILQVISRGYTAAGKTIRPARVVVARKIKGEEDHEAKSSEEQ